MQVFSSIASRGVRRQDGSRYATLTSCRELRPIHSLRVSPSVSGAWLARRWYYTPRSRRAYSVRQISPGDRRLLAEFALGLTRAAPERERAAMQDLTALLFDRVISNSVDDAVGFAALENTAAGDRVIGVAAYAPTGKEGAEFRVAVANTYREEQVGRTLLATLAASRAPRRRAAPDRRNVLVEPADADAGHVHGLRRGTGGARSQSAPAGPDAQMSF